MALCFAIPQKLPLLLMQNDVLLPTSSMRIPVTSSDNMNMVKSRLLSRNTLASTIIGVVSKDDDKDFEVKDAGTVIGTAAIVVQVTGTNWPKPAFTLLVTGLCRFRLEKLIMMEPYKIGFVTQLDYFDRDDGTAITEPSDPVRGALLQDLRKSAHKLLKLLDSSFPRYDKLKRMMDSLPISSLTDLAISMTSASYKEKQDILNTLDPIERFHKAMPFLQRQIEKLEIMDDIKKNSNTSDLIVKVNIPQRMMETGKIKNKIFDSDKKEPSEIDELHNKIVKAKMPEFAHKIAMKELKRLMNMGPFSPENVVIRNYLELMTELPWAISSTESIDIKKARKDLNADHHAMDKLKQRVLEYLAVRQIRPNIRAPILCFVGPPGVGKTSIGRSIANTLSRKFYRISLGGVNNQSHIRGHRRTYVGAMPGRIIQGLKTVGTNNPVILLDEIDKMDSSYGSPAAALLEVLDPEHNDHFLDHYLNVPFDLSQVTFIATANQTKGIPPALLDRMEIIHVNGYTQEEKIQIAEHYLLPKQMAEHGLDSSVMKILSDSIKLLITSYTNEAGVRSLERKIGALCRAVAVRVAENGAPSGEKLQEENTTPPSFPIVIDELAVEDILGPPSFDNTDILSRIGTPGVAVGLAWTATGGTLTIVEVSKIKHGEGKLVLTGHLGDVMKESAKIALNWVRTVACQYGMIEEQSEDLLGDTDIHIHFPAGAVGKDGPSAGVTIATALVSLFLGIPVASDVAMTGEITLRGVVLPVGGVKEKVLAAHRAGYRRVILPKRCNKDLFYIPQSVKSEVTFVFVSNMEEVLDAAFNGAITSKPSQSSLQSKL